MKTTSLITSSFALLVACGGSHQAGSATAASLTGAKTYHPISIDEDIYGPESAPIASPRVPGDYLVREIAMASRKTPLIMTERVLSKDGSSAVLEVAFKDGKQTNTYRVRVEETRTGEQTTEVTQIKNGVEHAFGVPAYEALLSKTVPPVDRNDGLLDAEPITVALGNHTIPATRTEYKVMIGGKSATMSVIQSKAIGDMGGEIANAEGKILFSARIVEMGNAPSGTASLK